MLRAALLAVLALAGAPAAAQAEPGLIATWHLDEVASETTPDASGNGHDGTAVLADRVEGRFGGALRLSDVPDGFLVPAAPALEPASVTAMAWVRRAGSPGAFRTIVGKGGRGCSDSTYGLYTGGTGGLRFYVTTAPQGQHTVSLTPAVATEAVWDGRWHAVAGTFDAATREVAVWLDGVKVGTATAEPGPLDYDAYPVRDLGVGRYPDPACALEGFQLFGDLDEVRLYDRALSAADLAFLQDPAAPEPRRLADPPAPPPPVVPVVPVPPPPPPPFPPPAGSTAGGPVVVRADRIEVGGAAGTVPPPLRAALEAAPLPQGLARPFGATRVVTGAPRRAAGTVRPYTQLHYGLPVEVKGVTGTVAVAAAVAVDTGKRVVRLDLPPVVSPVTPGKPLVVVPIDARAAAVLDRGGLDAAVEVLATQLDTLSELDETQSLRLQMLLDRRTKFMATLSNVMQRLAATQQSIVGNLKAAHQRTGRRRASARALRRRGAGLARRLAAAGTAGARLSAPQLAGVDAADGRATARLRPCRGRCRPALARR